MSEYVVNLFEFARTGKEVEGSVCVLDLPRMLAEVPPDVPESMRTQTVFRWRAHGFERAEPRADGGSVMRPRFHLRVAGDMWLECQRCMTPYREPLSTDTVFDIVKSEAEAEARSLDGDEPEPLVGAADFDLLALIEEELLLALPIVPKHEVCPSVHESLVTGDDGQTIPETSGGEPESGKPSPFAVLAALKKTPDNGKH